MLTQRDARVIESLPDIKVPSLVVVGADDTPFLAASDYMAAKIPGAQKVVIPAAGHAVNIDQPQAFIDAVLPFLDGLDTRATDESRVMKTTALALALIAGSVTRAAAQTTAADRRPLPAAFHRDAVEQHAAGVRHGRRGSRRARWAPRSIMSAGDRARKSISRSATTAAADCSTRRTGCFCNSARAGWPAGRATGATTGCGNSRGSADLTQPTSYNPKQEWMTRGTGYQTDGFGWFQTRRLSRRSRRQAEGGHRGDPGNLWRQSPHPLGLRPAGGRGLCRDRAGDLRSHPAGLPVRLFA